jgi:integrase
VKESLGTKDPLLARIRFLRKACEIEASWANLRSGHSFEQATPPGVPYNRERRIEDLASPCSRRPELGASTPTASTSATRDTGTGLPVPWRSLLAAYAAEANLAPATVKRWSGVMAELEAALGRDDLASISRRDLIDWKEKLLGSGRSANTVRTPYLSAVKAIMSYGVAGGRLEANVATGVVVKTPRLVLSRDRDFTDDEALAILRGSLQEQPAKLSIEHAAARRWVPWLCAYGGARVNEMTQLRGTDVRQVHGIWIVRITPEAGSVKTGRWREVPLHPHLVAQGFPSFAGSRGSRPLFYDPSRTRGGSEAHPIYKKVGERLAAWVRSLGVSDLGVDPNHGWRHRFKTTGRRAGIDPAVLDAIQGHAPRTEGERYGRHPIETLFEAIRRLPEYRVD